MKKSLAIILLGLFAAACGGGDKGASSSPPPPPPAPAMPAAPLSSGGGASIDQVPDIFGEGENTVPSNAPAVALKAETPEEGPKTPGEPNPEVATDISDGSSGAGSGASSLNAKPEATSSSSQANVAAVKEKPKFTPLTPAPTSDIANAKPQIDDRRTENPALCKAPIKPKENFGDKLAQKQTVATQDFINESSSQVSMVHRLLALIILKAAKKAKGGSNGTLTTQDMLVIFQLLAKSRGLDQDSRNFYNQFAAALPANQTASAVYVTFNGGNIQIYLGLQRSVQFQVPTDKNGTATIVIAPTARMTGTYALGPGNKYSPQANLTLEGVNGSVSAGAGPINSLSFYTAGNGINVANYGYTFTGSKWGFTGEESGTITKQSTHAASFKAAPLPTVASG